MNLIEYILILSSILFFAILFSIFRKIQWLSNNNLNKLTKMSESGKVYVPWKDILTPKNSKMVNANVVIEFINKRQLSLPQSENNSFEERAKKLLEDDSLIILKFRSPFSTWLRRIGTEGFLIIDPHKKEQLAYIEIWRN